MAKRPLPIQPKYRDDNSRRIDMEWMQQYHKNDPTTDQQTNDAYMDDYKNYIPQISPGEIQNYITNPEDVQAAQRTLPTVEEVMQYILRRGR